MYNCTHSEITDYNEIIDLLKNLKDTPSIKYPTIIGLNDFSKST